MGCGWCLIFDRQVGQRCERTGSSSSLKLGDPDRELAQTWQCPSSVAMPAGGSIVSTIHGGELSELDGGTGSVGGGSTIAACSKLSGSREACEMARDSCGCDPT